MGEKQRGPFGLDFEGVQVIHGRRLEAMREPGNRALRFGLLAVLVALAGGLALAQSQPAPRITQPIDDSRRVTLKGNVHPLAQPRYDRGAVPDSFPAERMLLLLQRSPESETALRQFIEDAHTPGSSGYHKWLKPAELASLYGPADSDVGAVAAWLKSHGFSVPRVSKGKAAIEFSGSAGQLREAFHTELHTYVVNGETHHANDRDPQIPAALESLVAGITSLNDFRPKSYAEVLGRAIYDPKTHRVTPQWTLNTEALALAPGDFAVQYDLNPLYNAGTNGAGVTIGLIGASNVDPTVVAAYRALFGLPPSALNVVIDGEDPGENGALIESYLDVEVSGAVAPGATINLYTAADTSVQSGLDLAALRAVDDDEAAVLSTSYGECEQALGSSENQFWAALWEQAAAQGQTSFVSSGDNGPAICDTDLGQPAKSGLAVNGFSSTPWNVSVGGTDFYYSTYAGTSAAQNAQLATYWNLTPSSLPAVSILKPIPEQPWNDAFGLNLATGGVYSPGSPTIVAGSGGASSCSSGVDATDGTYASCSGGYPKPAWQTGVGVPADGVRDLPDVSLFAANGANDSFYPICVGGEGIFQECVPTDGGVAITGVGGTSASSPAMAGIMALINQEYGRQGQANFTLYPLAAQHPTAFHDVTVGSNNVPCQEGTPSCTLSALHDNTNGFYTFGQYYATPGYDQATGLGSVDANLLVKYWTSLHFTPTNTSLALSQTSFTHGTPVTVTVGVSGSGGTPSGDVALVTTASPAVNAGLGEIALQNGAASESVNNLPGGEYTLTARYAGDTLFASSSSVPVALNVTAEDSTTSLVGTYYDWTSGSFVSLSNGSSYPYGTYIALDAQPTGVNAPAGTRDGIATGTVTFADAASTGTVSSGPVKLTSNGVAEWIPSAGFTAGSHSLTAGYSGDASFKASASAPALGFTITKAATQVTLSASPSIIGAGSTVALTLLAVVSPTAPPPTGTATFYFGATVLGTATLGPAPYNPTVGAAALNAAGLPLGIDAITATYSGDANCNPAAAPAINVTVEQPVTLSATLNPNPFNEAQNFTVAVTVKGVASLPVPTGVVLLSATGVRSSYSDAETLVNGAATISGAGNFFNPGNVALTVSYNGDSNYAPAVTTIYSSDAAPFTISATPVVIAAPGATTGNTSTVTVTPGGNFVGAVALSCALSASPGGAQDPPSCVIPSSVNITGTSAVTATMTINSTAASSGTASSAMVRPFPDRRRWLAGSGGAVLLGIALVGIPAPGRRRRSLLGCVFVLALCGILAGCHGKGSSGTAGGGNAGTTPGTYTFTATASTPGPNAALPTVSASAQVTVTIQ
jgi:hypothetical protein